MCELATSTLMYLQLAAAATAAVTAHQAAEASAKGQESVNNATHKGLLQEMDLGRMDAERQRGQEYQAAAAETNQYAAQARADMSTYDALLGEGSGGNSGDRRVAAAGIQNGENLATLKSNATKVQSELGFSERASAMSTGSKIASIRPVDRPSSMGTALTIAGAGIRYGQQQNAAKDPKSPFKGN